MFGLKSEISSWQIEVENEAARLVKEGVPPYSAMKEASRIVSERRANKACTRLFEGGGRIARNREIK